MSELKLAELAQRIGAHLKRFEGDSILSRRADGKAARFWNTDCHVRGRFVAVTYISHQGRMNVTKAEAAAYLLKLDAGFVGSHFEAQATAPTQTAEEGR